MENVDFLRSPRAPPRDFRTVFCNLAVEKFETVNYLLSMFHSEKLLVPALSVDREKGSCVLSVCRSVKATKVRDQKKTVQGLNTCANRHGVRVFRSFANRARACKKC